MPDDLRTRIAAVLDKHYPQTTGYHDELTDWCQCGMPRSHVVDVLIRELRLTRELKLEREDGECLYCHAQLPCGRWVAWDE